MTQINIHAENDAKKMAEKACSDIDLSLPDAINVYLNQPDRENGFRLKYLLILFIQMPICGAFAILLKNGSNRWYGAWGKHGCLRRNPMKQKEIYEG